MGTRRKGREAALQILYQVELSGNCSPTEVSNAWQALDEPPQGSRDVAEALATTALENAEKIDGLIDSAADNWQLERLSRVDLSLLRIAVCEMLYFPDVPVGVVVNEAIEIAKRYSDQQSAAFVNGILDRIAGELGRRE